jgi:hypothetical protein
VCRQNRYAGRVKPKAIIACAVVFVLLFFLAMLLIISSKPPQEITVRHVKSVQSSNVTTMTFEIKNHTTDRYAFSPFEVQVRNGTAWTKFQDFDMSKPTPLIAGRAVVSYTENVTNLPAGSTVRFAIRQQPVLLGLNGFIRRAEIKLKNPTSMVSLNPYSKHSLVVDFPTAVWSEEWVEAVK